MKSCKRVSCRSCLWVFSSIRKWGARRCASCFPPRGRVLDCEWRKRLDVWVQLCPLELCGPGQAREINLTQRIRMWVQGSDWPTFESLVVFTSLWPSKLDKLLTSLCPLSNLQDGGWSQFLKPFLKGFYKTGNALKRLGATHTSTRVSLPRIARPWKMYTERERNNPAIIMGLGVRGSKEIRHGSISTCETGNTITG